ncbi:UPF0102 protein [Marmoricola endophyticus]|uniref:UPF0102 protein GCM10011519_10660 n=1 Tax=Marmoricola endophyticus TaxID=2040280 RepID=A0A917F2N5_9ACTN|nr:YraN family protein [Marmoricola endophyticus]GGF38904.1 UPF0102 protein [Marmoricola endophyticus]
MSTGQQNLALGRYGEDVALRALEEQGLVLLERNWRCRAGEIDLILTEGETVVFCEVKTRRTTAYGHPLEAVTPVKAARLRLLAERWLEEQGRRRVDVRIDVVSVLQDGHGAGRVEHLRGVV